MLPVFAFPGLKGDFRAMQCVAFRAIHSVMRSRQLRNVRISQLSRCSLKHSISLRWLPLTSGDITLFIPRCQSETRQEIGVSYGRQFCCHSNFLTALFVRDGPVTCSHKNESAEGAATWFGFKTWLWNQQLQSGRPWKDGCWVAVFLTGLWGDYKKKKRLSAQHFICIHIAFPPVPLVWQLREICVRGDLSGWFW